MQLERRMQGSQLPGKAFTAASAVDRFRSTLGVPRISEESSKQDLRSGALRLSLDAMQVFHNQPTPPRLGRSGVQFQSQGLFHA